MSHIIAVNIKSACHRFFNLMFLNRSYSRNVIIRKPIRVLNNRNAEVIPPIREIDFAPVKSFPLVVKEEVSALIPKPEDNVISYEKLQKNDAKFTKLVGLIKNRKRREKTGKILLEGKRHINDAIKAGMHIETLYFSRETDLVDIKIANPKEIKVYKVLYQTMKVWSDLTTCPGVMAVFKRPSAEEIDVLSQSTIPVTILCDNIREPGNLGSIIRTAAAAGCENVLLLKGCVDPWEMKVLRSACGGHFRIPIVNDIEWTELSNYMRSDSTIFIADNKADIDDVHSTSDFINYDDEPEETEEETKYVTFNEHDQPVRIDESWSSQIELKKYEDIQLPCHMYSSIKYPTKNVVLYIGGETHGVDSRIVKLVCEFGGKKIKIPLENGMDSLNSAFAMTVVLFEIKRQIASQLYITK